MNGLYKAYGEYKDSGVEWLGEIPGNWGYISISRMFTRIKRTGHIERELLSVYRDYGVIPKSSRDDNNNMPSEDLSPYQLVEINDLVMNKMKAWQGSIAISECEGIVSPAYFVYSPKLIFNDLALPKYIHYLLRNSIYITQYLSRSKGIRVNQWDLDPDEFKSIDVLLPTKEEQFQIAAFLDHETAKIDTLIDKQQQLIELLKEKRQAVISHAVTKGLDPDVPMKDSGVEWLGEVPEHWKVLAIKKIVSTPITDGPHETPNFIDEGISFISAEAISSGVIDFSKQRACISIKDHIRFSEKYKPHLYDIYMVKSGATTGVSAIVETINDFNIWSPLAALRCSEIAFPYFVLYFLRSQQFLTAIELNWSFGTQQNIGMGVIGNIYISCPPIKEAIIISDHIRQKCSKIESLITLATHQISLMQERRTALISAAVTGKIDVRDWQVPATRTESDEVIA